MIKDKRIKRLLACFLGLTMGVCSTGMNAGAFDGPTHNYVTHTSSLFVCSKFEGCDEFYTPEVIERLRTFSMKPDEDENEGGYKLHFFNPATERNFMGEKESALTRFTGHYRKAVRYYKTGRYNDAWEELGRAIHFLEDLNTPVHTNYESIIDAGVKLHMHVEFEKRCVAVQEECEPSMNVENVRYYLENLTKEIGKSSAYLSADNFYALENKLIPRDTIAKYSISNAQKAVVGVLYRFYVEVNS